MVYPNNRRSLKDICLKVSVDWARVPTTLSALYMFIIRLQWCGMCDVWSVYVWCLSDMRCVHVWRVYDVCGIVL